MNRDRLPETDADTIICQQILEADHSVFSIQSVVIPSVIQSPISSANLMEQYLRHIKNCTAGIIRPVQTINGIEFRLVKTSLALIQFLQPGNIITATGDITTLNICGGLLVNSHECDRGQLQFMVEKTGGGIRLTLKLADYCPLVLGGRNPSLLRKWLYRFTQAYIHKVVTVNFLSTLYRKITGKSVRRGVIHIAVRDGIAT